MEPRHPPRTWLTLGLGIALLLGGAWWSRTQFRSLPDRPADVGLVIRPPERWVQATALPFEVAWSRDGRPVTGASVVFDLSMPAMAMPPNRFAALQVAGRPGVYRGTGVFTMAGRWQIMAIAREGSASAQASCRGQVR